MSLSIPGDVYDFYYQNIDEKLVEKNLDYFERLKMMSWIMYPCTLLNYYSEVGILPGLMNSIDSEFVKEEALNLIEDRQSNLVYDMVQVYQLRYYIVCESIDIADDVNEVFGETFVDEYKNMVYLKIREILMVMMISNESAYLSIVRYLSEDFINELLDQIFCMDGYRLFEN